MRISMRSIIEKFCSKTKVGSRCHFVIKLCNFPTWYLQSLLLYDNNISTLNSSSSWKAFFFFIYEAFALILFTVSLQIFVTFLHELLGEWMSSDLLLFIMFLQKDMFIKHITRFVFLYLTLGFYYSFLIISFLLHISAIICVPKEGLNIAFHTRHRYGQQKAVYLYFLLIYLTLRSCDSTVRKGWHQTIQSSMI